MSLLDDEEREAATVEVEEGKRPEVQVTQAPTGKRRGRPPGSKNKPKEETLSPNLEGAIRAIFVVCSIIAKFFGYEQVEDLTENEVKEGARAFSPLAQKVPWLATAAMYIGPPVWLYMTITKKFAKRESNGTNHGGNPDSGERSSDSPSESGEPSESRATG